MEKYTHNELVQLARPHLGPGVSTAKIESWADAMHSSQCVNHNWVCKNCPISRPSLDRLHLILVKNNPELLLQFPKAFTPKQAGKHCPRAKVAADGPRKPDPEFPGELAETRTSENPKKYLDKDNVREMLAKKILSAEQDNRIGDVVKLVERQGKISDWERTINIEYQIQTILPPGGVTALPAEVARLVAEIKERGILDAEYEPVPKLEAPSDS